MKSACVLALSLCLSLSTSFAMESHGKTSIHQTPTSLLMGKDIQTVMSALKLSVKDTIGKTGIALFPQTGDATTKFKYLNTKTGETLLFKDNKLKTILTDPKTKNPFSK